MDGWNHCYDTREGALGGWPFNLDHEECINFIVKAWWTLVQHCLSTTKHDNMLSLDRVDLFMGIMEGYDIDVDKIIAREICDRAVRAYTTLAISCLFT